jgi:chaperone modulatory protein CbpM
METEHLIPLSEFCSSHKIEISFINSLNEFGLIEVRSIEQTPYILEGQISDLEKMVRFHYEMDINIEGIEAISHLLQRIDNLHQELIMLRNRLKLYENKE